MPYIIFMFRIGWHLGGFMLALVSIPLWVCTHLAPEIAIAIIRYRTRNHGRRDRPRR